MGFLRAVAPAPTHFEPCAVINDLFGPDTDPAAVHLKLLSPGGRKLMHRMSYVTAVTKETLRLRLPGATLRMTQPGDSFTIQTPAGELCVDRLMIYQLHSIIHRDPRAFGDMADRSELERGGHLSVGRGIASDKSSRQSRRAW